MTWKIYNATISMFQVGGVLSDVLQAIIIFVFAVYGENILFMLLATGKK